MSYGYEFAMVGDGCFVTGVQPRTDAEKKGLKVGDRVLTLNGVAPGRENLWEINYLFRILRPQAVDQLTVSSPDGEQRSLMIEPKVEEQTIRLSAGLNYSDMVRRSSYLQMAKRRSSTVGDSLIIWKFPTFAVDEQAIDEMIGQSRKYPAMILDLRGNGGGRVETLLRLLGSIVAHDLMVGTRIARKPTPPLMAKTRAEKIFTGKLIVLVDNRSASASEMFARTLQLENRGVIVGDVTAGKVMESRFHFHAIGLGSWQGYGVVISDADILMPDGNSLEHSGVVPDIKLLPSASDMPSNRDPVLSYAVHLAGADISPEDAGKLFPIEWPKD